MGTTELKIGQRIDVLRLNTKCGYEKDIVTPDICRCIIGELEPGLLQVYHPNIIDDEIFINTDIDDVTKVGTLIIKSIK